MSIAATTHPDSDGQPGDRHCIADTRCHNYDHQARHPALLAAGRTTLCPDCLRVAERDVRQLPSDYAALEQWLPRPLSEWSDGQPKRARGELPLPLREYVLVLQRHIWWVTTAWEPVVRELDRLSDEVRRGVREGWAVQRAVTVIAPRLHQLAEVGPVDMADYPPIDDTISAPFVWGPDQRRPIAAVSPTGADGIHHLTRLHRLASAMTGLTERIRRLPGFCHACKEDEVLRQKHPLKFKHDPPVWCDNCGASQPYEDYERMMKLVVWQGAL